MTTEYSGSGDPTRTMALLWRGREQPGRARRSGLTVERIASAAIEVADAHGLAALSMRRVADRLGVGAMSLYTYVPGKAELVDLMLDTIYGQLDTPTDPPPGWRARLESVARQNWALYHRHPWMVQVAISRPVLGPNLMAKYDNELRAIAGVGLTEAEMDSVLTLVTGYVHGAARASVEAAQAEQRTGMNDEQWWSAHARLLERVFDPGRYPTAAQVGEATGGAYDAERAFEFGLQRILDGLDMYIRSRSSEADQP